MQPWTSVVNQWTCDGTSTINGGLFSFIDKDAAQHLIGARNDNDLYVKCAFQLQRMQRFYRRKLIQQFRKDFPDDLQSMQTFMQSRIQNLQQFANYRDKVSKVNDVTAPLTYMGAVSYPPDSSLFDATSGIFGVGIQNRPRLFYVAPPITNTLLAGVAEKGEFCGVASSPTDGSDPPASLLYINQGTKAAPNWVAFDDDSLVDFLINPLEILDSGYIRTVFYMQGFGTMIDNGEWDDRMKQMPSVAGISLKQALEDEAVAFSLLRPSLDGTGIVTDFVKAAAKKKKQFF